jgi:hypothetical protein
MATGIEEEVVALIVSIDGWGDDYGMTKIVLWAWVHSC